MTLEELRAKVKKLFPGFKSQGILRFSSLLGPGKPSSLPRIWREARKPKKRPRKRERHYSDGSDEEGLGCSWRLDVDFEPTPDMIATDDEVCRLIIINYSLDVFSLFHRLFKQYRIIIIIIIIYYILFLFYQYYYYYWCSGHQASIKLASINRVLRKK